MVARILLLTILFGFSDQYYRMFGVNEYPAPDMYELVFEFERVCVSKVEKDTSVFNINYEHLKWFLVDSMFRNDGNEDIRLGYLWSDGTNVPEKITSNFNTRSHYIFLDRTLRRNESFVSQAVLSDLYNGNIPSVVKTLCELPIGILGGTELVLDKQSEEQFGGGY